MSIKVSNQNTKTNKQAVEALHTAAKAIGGTHPALTIITGLLTESEQVTLGRRLLIAQQLLKGKTRMDICTNLHVSPNSVTRTRQWLTQSIPEYSRVVNQPLKNKPVRRKRTAISKPFTLERLKQNYPAHFLLIHALEAMYKRK